MNTSKYIPGLDAFDNFVLWRLDAAPAESKTGKLLKVPVHMDRPWINHSAEQPQNRSSAANADAWRAAHLAEGKYHDRPGEVGYLGVGFRPEGTGLACLDIDGCLIDGKWNDLAQSMFNRFPGAGMEVSTSGTGMHLWFAYTGESPGKRPRNPTNELELYAGGQFIALGTPLAGNARTDHTEAMHRVLAEYWPPRTESTSTPSAGWTTAALPGWRKPWAEADFKAEISKPIQRNSAGRVFAGKPDVATMWNSDPDEIAAHFAGDRSKARMSLLSLLIQKFGGNCEAVYNICVESDHPLAIKDGREKLLRTEIQAACDQFSDWWMPIYEREQAQIQEARNIGEGLGESIEPTVIPLDEMAGRLVYVTNGRGVVDSQDGRALSWADAIGAFAASTYETVNKDGKSKSHPSLIAWAGDLKRKTVDTLTWAPGRPEFCTPPEPVQGRTRAYNTWKGLRPSQPPQDWAVRVQPFLDHITYLVPEAAQRERFMQWLAHIVQHPGELPHTGYLMIANTTGVGRNWLSAILARVLAGYMASGVALGPLLDGKFNGRLSGKLLATVDETREGLGDSRYTRAESLKRTVTEEFRMIDHKYGMQVVEFNCCRWLMYSNHSDALPLDKMDRRIEVVDNPDWVQPAAYYTKLYGLRNDPEFIASVRQWMQTLDLSGFNPGAHASMSQAKLKAVAAVTPDLDRALEAFKAEWCGPFAPRSVIEDFVKDYTGEQHVRRGALEHGMKRMEWTIWDQRMMVGGRKVRPVSLDPLIRQPEMMDMGTEPIRQNMELQMGEWVKKQGFGA